MKREDLISITLTKEECKKIMREAKEQERSFR